MKEKYFSFEFIDKLKIFKEINKLDSKKACEEHDFLLKFIKSNKERSFFLFYILMDL